MLKSPLMSQKQLVQKEGLQHILQPLVPKVPAVHRQKLQMKHRLSVMTGVNLNIHGLMITLLLLQFGIVHEMKHMFMRLVYKRLWKRQPWNRPVKQQE